MKPILSLPIIVILFTIGCTKEKGADPTNPATVAQKAPTDGLEPSLLLTFNGTNPWNWYCEPPADDCWPEITIYGNTAVAALNQTVTGTTTGGPAAVASFFSDSANVMATFSYLYNSTTGKPIWLLRLLRSGNYSLTLGTNTTTNLNYYQVINASTGVLKMVMVDTVNTSL